MPDLAQSNSKQHYYSLTPDRVMDLVERVENGFRATGRCLALNSFENRVYEIELEDDQGKIEKRVAKFYRPGRWTREQILEEHQFLIDLKDAELPVVCPLPFSNGSTLSEIDGIYCSVFPKVGGRAPEELSDDQLIQVGRLLGRIHRVGKTKPAPHRFKLDTKTYGYDNLKVLMDSGRIPPELRSKYEDLCLWMFETFDPWIKAAAQTRIHGDCHLQNLLMGSDPKLKNQFQFIDFDDMLMGPVVQDFWLLLPGRGRKRGFQAEDLYDSSDQKSIDTLNQETDLLEISPEMEVLIEGYEEFSEFPRSQLNLIEPLRVLRMVHYSAWLAKRWEDPAFPRAFSQFESDRYWQEEVQTLELEKKLIQFLKSRNPVLPQSAGPRMGSSGSFDDFGDDSDDNKGNV